MYSSFFGSWDPIRSLQRPVTFDSEGGRSRTRYLKYSKFLRDSIFDGFRANGAKQIGEKQENVKKHDFLQKTLIYLDLLTPRVSREEIRSGSQKIQFIES